MRIRFTLFSLLLAMLLVSCGSPKSTVATSGDEQDTVDLGYTEVDKNQFAGSASTYEVDPERYGTNLTLSDILLRTPGVFVQGSGNNARAYIRGVSSGPFAREPLFVVDDIAVGRSLQSMTFLNPNDIDSVTVLKGASATTLYGRRGMNGVILIRTKTGN